MVFVGLFGLCCCFETPHNIFSFVPQNPSFVLDENCKTFCSGGMPFVEFSGANIRTSVRKLGSSRLDTSWGGEDV